VSIRFISWAFEVDGLSSSEKFVLVKLADNANDEGECWPSLDYIARHTSLSRPTVVKVIKKLEEIGVLEVTREKLGKVNLPNRYRLRDGDTALPVVKPLNHGGKATLLGGSKATLPEPSPLEPSLNRKEGNGADAPLPSSDADKAFRNWNRVAEQAGLPIARTLTADRRKRLNARLADIGGLAEWNAALENLLDSEFCCGKNDRGWKADFDFLLQPKSLNRLLEGSYNYEQADGKAQFERPTGNLHRNVGSNGRGGNTSGDIEQGQSRIFNVARVAAAKRFGG